MFKKRTRTANPRVKEDYSTPPPPRPTSSSTAIAAIEGESGLTAADTENRPVEDEEDEAPTGTLQEILLLRRLTQSKSRTSGIDLVRLNKGEEKKKRRKKPSGQRKDGDDQGGEEEGEEGEGNGGETYGLKQSRAGRGEGGGGEGEDAENDDASKARRLVRSNNFTQQTNALDVDKHMMAYIEAELAKRRQGPTTTTPNPNPDTSNSNKPEVDPQEELYAIAEKYRLEKYKPNKSRGGVDDEEGGNVTTSLGMLTSIPEVDLGMDIRLKNIEETERAKRAMMENRNRNRGQGQKRNEADESFAAARFYRPHHTIQSDAEALEDAKREAAGLPPLNRGNNRQRDRNETATDDQVYERFKKR
ncbi:hepatocellular carcinoma-associated antigen 59-domain-containing protein [Filobasidium floriforme]|uniref:hepatocellular carcinoma-associated antigen 59-domain-containing protein n=1 Tax=Filobasidium floriforme TaxID=5210 RepID=UPI001E8E3FD6|nr:hepatocellular carcinoma-associated antigen 59-domain-containing protein [Filobasidium floriforme]KAH8083499.1 hepatocellular carcinoma-associated antigen 59-domain-containing protein [Filobasidium floriforme]